MSEQAAKLAGPCPGCGSAGTGWAVQLTRDGRLRWEVEWACDACGIAHDGGWGAAPAEVRGQILAQHGPCCVRLTGEENRGAAVMKALRRAFDLSVPQAQEAARRLKQSGHQGTYVEVRFLAELMRSEGIRYEVLPGACE